MDAARTEGWGVGGEGRVFYIVDTALQTAAGVSSGVASTVVA